MTEKLSPLGDALGSLRNRRDFLRVAGLGGAALALGACGEAAGSAITAPKSPTAAGPSAATVENGNVVLDFSTDIDVLNYAYALEQLEAAFYLEVVGAGSYMSTFSANERLVLTDLADHEVAHRDFFAAALGDAKIPNLTPDFSAVNFDDRTSVLETARTFEDLGVGAYNGAARYLRNGDFLLVAGKIVSVEARHAAAIRDILQPRSGAFAPNAFDPALAPSAVLSAADPFIVENITVVNA